MTMERLRMTMEESCHSEEQFPPLCHSEEQFPRSVILRSGATKNLRAGIFGTREKILRYAQNDNGGSPE